MHRTLRPSHPLAAFDPGGDRGVQLRREVLERAHDRTADLPVADHSEDLVRGRVDEGELPAAVDRHHPGLDVPKNLVGLEPDLFELGGQLGLLLGRGPETVAGERHEDEH